MVKGVVASTYAKPGIVEKFLSQLSCGVSPPRFSCGAPANLKAASIVANDQYYSPRRDFSSWLRADVMIFLIAHSALRCSVEYAGEKNAT